APDPIPPDVRPSIPHLRDYFASHPGAELEEVVQKTGVSEASLGGVFDAIREQIVIGLVAEKLDRRPEMTFEELRREFLPEYSRKKHGADLVRLQGAYWHWRCRRALEARTT